MYSIIIISPLQNHNEQQSCSQTQPPMLKLNIRSQIQWKDPLTHLNRYSSTITGINTRHELIEIDTRNYSIDRILTYKTQQIYEPQICDVKYMRCDIGNQYYFVFDKEIKSSSGNIVITSNSKADFVKGLDGKEDLLVFMKQHNNHNKYSLNTMKIGQEKKIVRLFDQEILKVNIIGESCQRCIILEKNDGNVQFIFGEYWDSDENVKNKKYYCDSNFVYLMSSRQKNETIEFESAKMNNTVNKNLESPREGKQYQGPKSPSNRKIRIEAYEQGNITKGKGYSEFEFSLERAPIKIDSFQNDLLVAFPNCLEIYDIRKIIKPYQKQTQVNVKDFYYEPNLQKIYLSAEKGLFIYDYK